MALQNTEDSDDSDVDDDPRGGDSVTATYSATVSCAMPVIDLPPALLDPLTDCMPCLIPLPSACVW
jgi:hypothetical protein